MRGPRPFAPGSAPPWLPMATSGSVVAPEPRQKPWSVVVGSGGPPYDEERVHVKLILAY